MKNPGASASPRWLWPLIIALAATQPLLCLWHVYLPPAGMVSTGLQIPDSAIFLQSMRMFREGLSSPYATCHSPYSSGSIAYYPMPYLWVYGGIGWLADRIRADHFLTYGFATGLSALIYLRVVYGFMRAVAPRHANLAFALFSLSGGVGGVLYILTYLAGFHAEPAFDGPFRRFALYELSEGAYLAPVTYLPRLYYTASLALCLAGFLALRRSLELESRPAPADSNERTSHLFPWRHMAAASMPFFLGSFLNPRYGVFTASIVLCFLLFSGQHITRAALTRYAVFLLIGATGWFAGWSLLRTNPAVIGNHLALANQAAWFSPLVAAMLLHLPSLTWTCLNQTRRAPFIPRALAGAGIGYLMAFAALFTAYQAYYGNLLVARDAAVATAISDWALPGGVVGAIWVIRHKRTAPAAPASEYTWLLIWFLGFFALAISAFGQGWFLRFGPQRLMPLIWLPLCILSAAGLEHLRTWRPRFARIWVAGLLASGGVSVLLSVLCYQGPIGRRAGVEQFAYPRTELMTRYDAELISRIDQGVILATPPASDVAVLHGAGATVFGIGTFNLSGQPFLTMEQGVRRFFDPRTPEPERRAFVKQWRVDWIYCADTWPLHPETVKQLRGTSWLEETASGGAGALFRVVRARNTLPVD